MTSRRRMALFASLFTAFGIGSLVLLSVWRSSTMPLALDVPSVPTPLHADVTETITDAHPVYPYSVVLGGVHSREDLVKAVADPIVADHYSALDIQRVSVRTLSAPQQAYMSYRVGNRVFWTKNKITMPAGEQVLSDGKTSVRARCGNGISEVAMLPTVDAEPPASEFDRAMAPEPEPEAVLARNEEPGYLSGGPVAAPLVEAPAMPAAAPMAAPLVSALAGPGPAARAATPYTAPLPIGSLFGNGGGGGFPGGSDKGTTPETTPDPAPEPTSEAAPEPTPEPEPGPTVSEQPAPPSDGPTDNPGGGGGGSDTPDEPENVPGPPDTPVDIPQSEQPVPAPEPATLTLLGGGLAFIANRIRAKRKQQASADTTPL